jgi:hypothetical protein
MKAIRWLPLILLVGCSSDATGPEREPTWTVVGEWRGNGSTTTPAFTVPGEWRVIRTTSGKSQSGLDGLLSVFVYKGSGEYVTLMSGEGERTDTSYVHGTSGPHYLDISSIFVDWVVRVERQ